MSPECADLDLFFDGELPAEAAAGFRAHLATCDRCPRVLRGRMQEEVIAQAADHHAAQPAAPATARKPRRILYLTQVMAAAAAAATWLLVVRPAVPAEPIAFSLSIDHTNVATRSSAAHIGDVARLVVRGPGHRALWVYLGERELVVACPGGAGCGGDDHQLALELPLRAPGSYAIIAIVSAQPIAPPQGAVDVMLSAATGAGALVKITHVEVN